MGKKKKKVFQHFRSLRNKVAHGAVNYKFSFLQSFPLKKTMTASMWYITTEIGTAPLAYLQEGSTLCSSSI